MFGKSKINQTTNYKINQKTDQINNKMINQKQWHNKADYFNEAKNDSKSPDSNQIANIITIIIIVSITDNIKSDFKLLKSQD